MPNTVEVTITGRERGLSASFDKINKRSKETAESFGRLEEASDSAENKAQGFASTLTGTADVMAGFGQVARGDVFGGLVTLGGGFADLAEGVNYTVVPALRAMTKISILQAKATVQAAVSSARLTVVEKARAVVTKGVAVAQRALNLVMRANPIGLVITAIVALIAIFTALYKNNKGFRDFVDRMWRSIRQWVATAVKVIGEWLSRFGTWLRTLWTRSAGFRDALGRIFSWIARHIGERLKNARESFNILVAAFRTVRDQLAVVRDKIGDIFGRVASIVSSKLEGARKKLIVIVDRIKTSVINPLIRMLNKIPGVNISPLQTLAGQQAAAGARFRQRRSGGRIGPEAGYHQTPILAETDEHMWSKEEVRKAGGHQVIERLRAAVRAGKGLFESPTGGDPRNFVQRLAMGGAVAVRNFAKRFHGNDYLWGGTGPRFDCSGWVSALLNVWEGRPPFFRRRFTTRSIAAGNGLVAGLAPRRGNFNIGSYTGNPGHMAATVDGTDTETGGGHGYTAWGGPATGAFHSRFNRKWHASGGFDWVAWIKKRIAGLLDRVTGAFSGDSFALRIARAVVRMARDHMLGSLATGTRYVPRTGPYMLHKGEQVIRAGDSREVRVVFDFRGANGPLQRAIMELVRKGIREHGGGVVAALS